MTFGRLISLALHNLEAEPEEAQEIEEFALEWLNMTLTPIEDIDIKIRPEL